MRTLGKLIGLVVIVTVVATAFAQERPADDQAVRRVTEAVPAALNARDYARAASLFAEDGDLIGGNGPRVSGREAIRAMWEEWRKDFPDCRVDITVRAVRFLARDVAMVDATAELAGCIAARDRATYLVVRRGGKWQVGAMRVMAAERHGGQAAATALAESRQDEAVIRKLPIEQWCAAEKAQDIEAKIRLFTEDAVIMPPGSADLTGHKAIRAEIEERWRRSKWECTGTVDAVQVFGDWGIVRGTFSGVATPKQGTPERENGKYLNVVKRGRDGTWRIAWAIWNLNSSGAGTAPELDPVKLSPHLYKVHLDNEHVRVIEYRARPGTQEPMHWHSTGIGYTLADTRGRSTTPDGKSEVQEFKAGRVGWIDAMSHSWEDIGPGESGAFFVELKHLAAEVPSELREAMRARDQAVFQADAHTWDRLTAASFTVVREDGRSLTKAERLAELKKQQPTAFIAPEQEQVSRFGDTVIRRFRAGNLWVLDVWVRQRGAWRVAAVQLTTVAETGGHPATTTAAQLDPVKLSPHLYKVLLENEHVRVLEFRAKPGTKELMHSHPSYVVYSMSDAKLRLTTADGQSEEREIRASTVVWGDAVTHSGEVLGPGDLHVVIVELKHLP